MKFDRGPEFRRPRVGPYRQTRTYHLLVTLSGVVAKAVKGLFVLATVAFYLLVESAGGSTGPTLSRSRSLIFWGAVVAIAILSFLLFRFRS